MLTRVTRAYSTAQITARDAAGHLLTVLVKVRGGLKTGPAGVPHLLAKWAFLGTEAKLALRFTREAELLGAEFHTQITRDAIVLQTLFLKQDLPYFVEALGNVLARPLFRPHEFSEVVVPVAKAEHAAAQTLLFVALETLHEQSFRRGLGLPLFYDGALPATMDDVVALAQRTYAAGNVEIVALGVNSADLDRFVQELPFALLPQLAAEDVPTHMHTGAEARVRRAGESVAALGVPVKKGDFAKYEVLAAAAGTSTLPGSGAPLQAIPGANAKLYKYEDAGLFVVSVRGAAAEVAQGIRAAKKAVLLLSKADLKALLPAAELLVALHDLFEFGHNVKVTADSADAKLSAFNYVAVGNTDVLPFKDEL